MKTQRRDFLKTAGLGLGALAFGAAGLPAAEKPAAPSFAKASNMRIGMVTYLLGKDWDVATIIKNCEATKFQGVELRADHKHGVEVTLNKEQRDDVRKEFEDSDVELTSMGSAFDYHTADQAKLKKDIEATKQYIVLAHDVGASGIKVRPNGFVKDVPKQKTLEQIGKSLLELGAFAEGYGQQIRLEVHGTGTALLPNIKTIMDVAKHPMVGVCWNSNQTDLEGEGFDHNFNLVKERINQVHMRDLSLEEYPFRKLLTGLNEMGYNGYCLAEIPESTDPVRVMKYYRSLWLAYQGLL